MNGDAEKVTTNGDAKKDETEEETKEADDANETLEDADKSTSEKKKTSTKDKIKKKMSFRTMNFLKRKKKEDANESKNEVSEFFKRPSV